MSSRGMILKRCAVWCIAIIVGLVGGGVFGGCVMYRVSENVKIGGFPIPAYAWERLESGAWIDFVGPFTLPVMVIDFLLGLCLCGGIVYWLGMRVVRDRPACSENPPNGPAPPAR